MFYFKNLPFLAMILLVRSQQSRGNFSTFLDDLRFSMRLNVSLIGLGLMLSTTPSCTTSQFFFTYLDLYMLEVDSYFVSFWRVSSPFLTMNSSMQIACVTMSSKVCGPWNWMLYPKSGRKLSMNMSLFNFRNIAWIFCAKLSPSLKECEKRFSNSLFKITQVSYVN